MLFSSLIYLSSNWLSLTVEILLVDSAIAIFAAEEEEIIAWKKWWKL